MQPPRWLRTACRHVTTDSPSCEPGIQSLWGLPCLHLHSPTAYQIHCVTLALTKALQPLTCQRMYSVIHKPGPPMIAGLALVASSAPQGPDMASQGFSQPQQRPFQLLSKAIMQTRPLQALPDEHAQLNLTFVPCYSTDRQVWFLLHSEQGVHPALIACTA